MSRRTFPRCGSLRAIRGRWLHPRPQAAGLSLVELMVGIAIGLTIVTALLTLLVSTNRHNAELARSGQISESGRFALQILADEVSHAGFWGGFIPSFDDLTTVGAPGDVPTAVPDPCLDFNVTTPASLWTGDYKNCLLYTSPSPRDRTRSRMPSSA